MISLKFEKVKYYAISWLTGTGDRDLSILARHQNWILGGQSASDHMLLVVRKQGREFLPSWSDNPRLEVVLLLTGHTDRVTQVLRALGAAQLVSPGERIMLVAVSPRLFLSQIGSVGKCWVLIEVLEVRIAPVDHQLLKNGATWYSL